MRKLSSEEREYVKKLLSAKTVTVEKVMKVFQIFGCLQILAILLYMVFGNKDAGMIPFMLVGCVILYLVYFKFTGFLAKQNQWKRMLECVKKGKEFAFDVTLVNTYKTKHGEKIGAEELMGTVLANGKEIRCNVDATLMGKKPGTRVVLIATYNDLNYGFRLAIAAG